jgi:3-hydroxyisobutyrate dehydrogenase-like beta-hydroxyacid dehydrogenase
MDIAVLGMGRMGQALAGRLLEADHHMTIWNRTPGKAPDLVDRGAAEARSIPEAVGGTQLAITVLANDDAVRAVALGDDGVRSALPDGATYVDSSTVSPSTAEQLADAFARFVAMPVLGSPSQAASGQATFLVGARDGCADAVDPLFPALSEKRIRYDQPAMAAAAKLSVNLMLLDGVVALAEAFAAGRAGGLSEDQLRELLGNSPMVAPGLKYRFEGILTGEQEPFWTTVLGVKDARLAVELGESGGGELPLTSVARDLYQKAASRSETADIASVTELYRR